MAASNNRTHHRQAVGVNALRAHSASHARASDSAVSGKNFTGPLRRPAPVKASTCASHRGLPTTAIFSKSLRWLKKKSVSPHCSPRSHPEKFSSRTRSLTVPAPAIISTNLDCAASSSDFFSSPPTRRTRRRLACCSRLALMDVWFGVCGKNSLSSRHEEHSDDGKNEHCHTEGRGVKPHSWRFKLSCRAGKEEHSGKEDGVGEILAGAITRIARLGEPRRCVSPRGRRFLGAADLVKIRHKWVRVGSAILEWLLREPCFVGLLHIGRKTLGIKAGELFVASLLRSEELHEHRGVNDQRLAALHIEQRCASLERIGFVHEPVGLPGPRGGLIRAPRRAQRGQRHQHRHDGLEPFFPERLGGLLRHDPSSLASFDDLLQNPQSLRLHRAHANSRHEPHALLLSVAVDDLNAVVRRRMMERGARVLGDEAEELFPPRVIHKREEFFAERLQLLRADGAYGFRDRLAPGFRDFLHVYGFEWHDAGLV